MSGKTRIWPPFVGVAVIVGALVLLRNVRFREVPLPTDTGQIAEIAADLGEGDAAAFRRFMVEYRQQLVIDPHGALEHFGGRWVQSAVVVGRKLLADAPLDVHDELGPLPGAESEVRRIKAALPNEEAFWFRMFVDAYHFEFSAERAMRGANPRRLTVREAITLGRQMEDEFLDEQPPWVRDALQEIRHEK